MSVTVFPVRAAATRKKDAPSPWNCRNSLASSCTSLDRFSLEPLDNFYLFVYYEISLATKLIPANISLINLVISL